jgi:4-hydroxybenzoate polyprenyltransferase
MKAIDVFYYTGILIALSSTSSVSVFSWFLYQSIKTDLVMVIFLITVGNYCLDRLVGAEKDKTDHPDRSKFFLDHRTPFKLITPLILAFGILIAFFHSLTLGILVLLTPVIVLLYSHDSKTVKTSLKRIPYIKDMVIAGGWTALLLVVIVYNDLALTLVPIFVGIGIFGKFYVMAVLYDFKDIKSDQKNDIRTLPNSIGEQSTKYLLNMINIISTLWLIALVYYGIISEIGYLFIPACFYQTLLIGFVNKNAEDWVYYILCDLEQAIWLVFAVIIMVIIWV